jgi:hypothetical protein
MIGTDILKLVKISEEMAETLKDIRELLEANLLASKSNYRPTGGARDVVID